MDKAKFYDMLRGHKGFNITEEYVFGMEKHLDYAMHVDKTPLDYLAMILSQSHWETGGKMHPVIEAHYVSKTFEGAEAWRKRNLRYWPWHGRGLVQTTWEYNYENIAVAMGLPPDFFKKDPDKLLEWKYSLPALFMGIRKGIYTGKSVSDYVDGIDESDAEDMREFANARRVVNGLDKAGRIAEIAIVYEHALRAAGYSPDSGKPLPPVTEPKPPVDYVEEDDYTADKSEGWLSAVIRVLSSIFRGIG